MASVLDSPQDARPDDDAGADRDGAHGEVRNGASGVLVSDAESRMETTEPVVKMRTVPRRDAPLVDPVRPGRQDARIQPDLRTEVIFPKRGDLPVLEKCRCPRFARWAAGALFTGLVFTILLMALSPWQQTVKASGVVINYNPAVRPQPLEAPISGRVVRLGPDIREMAFVKKGQLVAELADLDPDRLSRLESQQLNLEASKRAAQTALEAAESELRQAEMAVDVYRSNVTTLESVKRETIATAEANVLAAEKGRDAAVQLVAEREAVLRQAEADFERQRTLYNDGFASELKFQTAQQKFESARAALGRAEADLEAAETTIVARRKERDTKAEAAQASIETATATLRNAEGKVESSRKGVSSAEQSLQKATFALTDAETAVRRQSNQNVTAPIDGYLVAIYADAGSSVVSQGEPIARIVPKSEDRVVELYLDGNDAPLVEQGRHVRLQFEGWPAIQFAGWPSVAVGTFGGEVISVDATDNESGKFRTLVKEVSGVDKESGLVEEPWPRGRFLRPGVRANGWVLLDTVPLWWEVWRNLNGFPPVVDTSDARPEKVKRPKLPKS